MVMSVQTGWKSWGVQATESPLAAWLLFASAALFVIQAATAGGQQWGAYSKLFDESRFCHVTTIDFLALTLSAPVWMWNDAEVRQWQDRYGNQQAADTASYMLTLTLASMGACSAPAVHAAAAL